MRRATERMTKAADRRQGNSHQNSGAAGNNGLVPVDSQNVITSSQRGERQYSWTNEDPEIRGT